MSKFTLEVVGARAVVTDLEAARAAWAEFVAAIDELTPEGEFPLTGALSGSSDRSEAFTIHAADTRPAAEPEPALEP